MTERPILFSGPMVRAILDGRKTQTRRVIEPQPPRYLHGKEPWNITANLWGFRSEHNGVSVCHSEDTIRCPYGQPRDLLWVREKWCLAAPNTWDAPKRINPNRADEAAYYAAEWTRCEPRWRPSIHMPKWAARLWLRVTDVRVEQLRSIPVEDINAEGVMPFDFDDGTADPWGAFARLWDSINEKRGFPWSSDPWVWVVEFERADLEAGRASA